MGGSWRVQRIYPSLYAQVKYGQFEYSFFPMRNEGISNDGYISGGTINRYLLDFARAYDLVRRSRLSTTVREIIRLPEGRGWRLRLESSGPDDDENDEERTTSVSVIETTKLIYASGPTSHAVVPSWPSSNFNVPTIHSSETGVHLDRLAKIERATVVGGAKSAFDTVFMLLKAGKKVDWVIRKDGSGAVALMPPTIWGLVNTIDVMATRFFATFGASIMNTQGTGSWLVHRTSFGRVLHRAFWRFVTWIAETHGGYKRSANAYKLRPLPHGEGLFWANAGLGCASVPDFWKVFHAGDCTVHRSEPTALVDNKVRLRESDDGSRGTGAQTELNTDYLILCTGFDKNYEPFTVELQEECGLRYDPADAARWARLEADTSKRVEELLPVLKRADGVVKVRDIEAINAETVGGEKKALLYGPSRHYRRMVVPALAAEGDRSIIFPGLMHNVYTPLVGEVQALWGVAFLLGKVNVPPLADMEKEVAEWNVWTCKRYRTQGRKHSYAIYDFISYIDTLLRDLGINTRRKANFLADTFLPYYPRHYRGLEEEFWKAQAAKACGKKEAVSSGYKPREASWSASLINALSLIALLAPCIVLFFLLLLAGGET